MTAITDPKEITDALQQNAWPTAGSGGQNITYTVHDAFKTPTGYHEAQSIPEPGTFMLSLLGACLLVALRRARK